MSISLKNINNCNDLDKNKVKNIANKLNIKVTNKKKDEICASIKKKYKIVNPCSSILSDDTDLTLKKHQLNVANFLYNTHGVAVIHSVGTGKTLTAHRKVAVSFRDLYLYQTFQIALTTLKQLQQRAITGITENQSNKMTTFALYLCVVRVIYRGNISLERQVVACETCGGPLIG